MTVAADGGVGDRERGEESRRMEAAADAHTHRIRGIRTQMRTNERTNEQRKSVKCRCVLASLSDQPNWPSAAVLVEILSALSLYVSLCLCFLSLVSGSLRTLSASHSLYLSLSLNSQPLAQLFWKAPPRLVCFSCRKIRENPIGRSQTAKKRHTRLFVRILTLCSVDSSLRSF